MIPGATTYIKDTIETLKRISDSKRRANALKSIDILLAYDNDYSDTELEQVTKSRLKIAKDILATEYRSPSKHSV